MKSIIAYSGHEKELDFHLKLLRIRLTTDSKNGCEIVQAEADQPDFNIIELLSWLNSMRLFSKKALFLLNIDKLKVQDRKELIGFIEDMLKINQMTASSSNGAKISGSNIDFPQNLLVVSYTHSLSSDISTVLDNAVNTGLAKIEKVRDLFKSASGFIEEITEQTGKQISEEAIHLLLMSVQIDPMTIKNEIHKLAAYVEDREIIDVDDIRIAGSASAEKDAFDFQDLLNRKDLNGALLWLGMFIEGKRDSDLISLMSLLYSNYRKMLELKSMLKTDRNIDRLAKIIGINPIRARILVNESTGYAEDELASILKALTYGQYRNRRYGILLTDCLKDILLFRCKGISSPGF